MNAGTSLQASSTAEMHVERRDWSGLRVPEIGEPVWYYKVADRTQPPALAFITKIHTNYRVSLSVVAFQYGALMPRDGCVHMEHKVTGEGKEMTPLQLQNAGGWEYVPWTKTLYSLVDDVARIRSFVETHVERQNAAITNINQKVVELANSVEAIRKLVQPPK
jgi:hypothetical protein